MNETTTVPEVHSSSYDRDAAKTGIVHIGFSAFHRAHQAVYIDNYMERSDDLSWGICAVNLRQADSQRFLDSAQQIESNDGYLLKTTSPNGDLSFQRVRSHTGFIDCCSDMAAAVGLLASPDVTLLTMTVTESGYVLDSQGNLDTTDNLLRQEISRGAEVLPAVDSTVYGYLAGALEIRAAHINQPLTVCCCDNLRENGTLLRKNFLKFLQLIDKTELADWVTTNVTFPCSMVDRITPVTTPAVKAEIKNLADNHSAFTALSDTVIHAESFWQWVLEKQFAGPMPQLTDVGVEITADVSPYEEAKIRILNGGHSSIAYMGVLSAYDTFDEALKDPIIASHFYGFEHEEVLVGLPADLPFDPEQYLSVVSDRFANQAIADKLARICMDGYAKMQIFIRPTVEACMAKGVLPSYALLSIASWFVYARRIHRGELKASYTEPNWHHLEPLLNDASGQCLAASEALWADLPTRFKSFQPELINAIQTVEEKWPQ